MDDDAVTALRSKAVTLLAARIAPGLFIAFVAALALGSCAPGRGGSAGVPPSSPAFIDRDPAVPLLHISDATYLADNGNACDATSAVREICEGTDGCSVHADNELCGDPARSHAKTLVIGYKCSNRRNRIEIRLRERRDAELHC